MGTGRGQHFAEHRSAPRPWVLVLVFVAAAAAVGGAWALDRSDRVDAVRSGGAGVAATGEPNTVAAAGGSPTPRVAQATTSTTARGPLGSGEPVTIAFAGDINFEGPNRARLDSDPSSLLADIAPVLSRADVAIGNLETALGTTGSPWPGKQFTFRAPPAAIDVLRSAGFDVVSMANNHGMDYGTEGLAASLEVARAQPDRFVIGIGGDEDEAYAPFTTVVQGQRIAVIGATQVIGDSMIPAWTATDSQGGLASAKRVDRLVEEVHAARATSDTVVVFLHWGIEKETCPSGDQQALAAALTEAGADLVVGGHAHRVQGAGRLGPALVGYGLGNFLWNAQSEESATTGVLEVTVRGRHVDGYRWVPARITGGSPRPLAGAEAAAAVEQWSDRQGCTGLAP